MTEHMSAKDYQRLIVNGSKDDGAMSDEDFHKALHGIDEIAGEKTSDITFGEAKVMNKKVAKKMEQFAQARDRFYKNAGEVFIDEMLADTKLRPVKVAKIGWAGSQWVKDAQKASENKLKPKKKQTNDSPLEDDVTQQVAEYLDLLMAQGKVIEYSHVPQETYTKNWGTKMKNKRMGVRSGVPDMIIVFSRGILFLELKREKGGVVSEAQTRWIEAINAILGDSVQASIARGFKQAENLIIYFAEKWKG